MFELEAPTRPRPRRCHPGTAKSARRSLPRLAASRHPPSAVAAASSPPPTSRSAAPRSSCPSRCRRLGRVPAPDPVVYLSGGPAEAGSTKSQAPSMPCARPRPSRRHRDRSAGTGYGAPSLRCPRSRHRSRQRHGHRHRENVPRSPRCERRRPRTIYDARERGRVRIFARLSVTHRGT